MEDDQVRREGWEGTGPVCFSIADEDVGYNRRSLPEPCYVSQYSYNYKL